MKIDNNILKYRKLHHKCKFCKYYHIGGNNSLGLLYKECLLKDELINNIFFKNFLCKWYEINEKEVS